MYITAASTISHQPTFRNAGFSRKLTELPMPSAIQHPDYGAFIPANSRRRMSDVLKMAVACATDCLEQTGLSQPDAIIVGTSMGCNHFTKNFLDKIIAADGGLLSPTSFTMSTHNTIAGQISLVLGNHEHNMTHTQNSLSFEQALIDAVLCIREGGKNVLVGGADEMENALYNMNARLNIPDLHSTCGASFFILSAGKAGAPGIVLVDVGSFGLIDHPQEDIMDFLQANGRSAEEIDLVLYAVNREETVDRLGEIFAPARLCDYQKIVGTYFTNSAFALHYAVDILQEGKRQWSDGNVCSVLICNNLIPENLGVMLVEIRTADRRSAFQVNTP